MRQDGFMATLKSMGGLRNKKLILLIINFFLVGCAIPSLIDKGEYKVDISSPSTSQNERICSLVFHYTATDNSTSLQLLTADEVSAHYLIYSIPALSNGKPIVLQLVPEEKRAWHAGVSYWNGRNNLNDTSIGIEIVNLGFTEEVAGKRWYPYNQAQIDLLVSLAKDIIQRYGITPDNVVAHSDIAPLRKYDPGPLFPWEKLAEKGIGAWPDEMTVNKYLAGRYLAEPVPVITLQKALADYGYQIPQTGILDEETRKVISAFQMHFRSADISGEPDAQTEAIALALVEKYKS
jgi:N-acetylmuramoyl-L-alanine amidase